MLDFLLQSVFVQTSFFSFFVIEAKSRKYIFKHKASMKPFIIKKYLKTYAKIYNRFYQDNMLLTSVQLSNPANLFCDTLPMNLFKKHLVHNVYEFLTKTSTHLSVIASQQLIRNSQIILQPLLIWIENIKIITFFFV